MKYKTIFNQYKKEESSKCKTCGVQEAFIWGIKEESRSHSYYTADGLRRSSTLCSKCLKEYEEKKRPKKRTCPVYFYSCQICESSYSTPTKNNNKYCSDPCRNKASLLKRLKRYHLDCKQCGNSFVSNTKKKYCSQECVNKSRIKPPRTVECKVCGSEFLTKKSNKYCSVECRDWKNISKEDLT